MVCVSFCVICIVELLVSSVICRFQGLSYLHVPDCIRVFFYFVKDRAHLSTFKIFIFEKFSCFIVLVVFLVIVQSSELVSVWFCEKMTFFPNFFSYHIFAIYVGGASLGLPTACRLIAVSAARLPSVDGLVVMCIKMHHHVKSAITICFKTCLGYIRVYQHTEALLLCFTYKKLRHEGFM